jgi:hypothetical protein
MTSLKLLAVWMLGGAIFTVALLYVLGVWLSVPAPMPSPSASASVSALEPKSDLIDTRTDAYAKHQTEEDKWLGERTQFAGRCLEQNGVPVFTFGMRVFCVSRAALIDSNDRGAPDRPAPEFPR